MSAQSLGAEVSGVIHTRASEGVRKLSEKGIIYQSELCTKRLKAALQKHKKLFNDIGSALENKINDAQTLLDFNIALENVVTEISTEFHELGTLSQELQDEYRLKFEQVTQENRDIRSKVTHALRVIENVKQVPGGHSSQPSRKSESHRSTSHKDGSHRSKSHRSDSGSHKSGSHRRDSGSHKSRSHKSDSGSSRSASGSLSKGGSSHATSSRSARSSVASMKLEAAAKAAILKVKLEFHDAEAEQKGRLDKQKSDLNKLALIRDIAVEEAKLKAISSFSEAPEESGAAGETNVFTSLVNSSGAGINASQVMTSRSIPPPTVLSVSHPTPLSSVPPFSEALIPSNSVQAYGQVGPSATLSAAVINDPVSLNVDVPVSNNFTSVRSSYSTGYGANAPPNGWFPKDYSIQTSVRNGQNSRNQGVGLTSHLASELPIGLPGGVTCNKGGVKSDMSVGTGIVQNGVINEAENEAFGGNTNVQGSVSMTQVPNACLNHNAPVFVPSADRSFQIGQLPRNEDSNDRHFVESLKTVINANKLPVPEPGVFEGDPLDYPAWRSTFHTLIESRNIDPPERIHFLKRYLGVTPQKCVKGFLMVPSADSYYEAMRLIERRYGNDFVIAQAFKSRIQSWSKISGRDAIGLRDFCDFLRQCEVAARTNPSLKVLDDDSQNHIMLSKLPDWLVARWSRLVYDITENQHRYPTFCEFVRFLCREADIACNPVTMLQSGKLNSAGFKSEGPKGSSEKVVRTLNTTHVSVRCIFCDMTNHALDKCLKFLKKSMDERKAFIIDKRLCFGCLTAGHVSKQCKNRLKCSTCSKLHPSPLHGDVRPKVVNENVNGSVVSKSSQKGDKSTNADKSDKSTASHISLFCNQQVTCKSTMIIPVYVSHELKPQNEVLVYALLDSQSDTSFISESTYAKLGVEGTDTVIKLATMTEDCGLLRSQRLGGLLVRGFNSEMKIALPSVFTHGDIPCSRDTIPTPQMAMRWPYLQCIAGELMPKSDLDIGLLIGYNCPRALAPRDVIPPEGDGPFAQKTILGWSIVGNTYASSENEDHFSLACTQRSGIQIALRTSAKEVFVTDEMADPFEKGLSCEDRKFLTLMESQIHKTEDGHYEMPMPFRKSGECMINNRTLAFQRLNSLIKRFKRDPLYFEHYLTFMNDLLQSGYAERVPDDELGPDIPAYYLPHHGVYNSSKPGKVRVVMDASAKYMGQSLNSNLLTGPDLLNGLVGVLCRFRQGYVAFTCDVKGMFQQFRVNEEHRNFLRFFWFENGDYNSQPVVFRSRVHLFGAASSPAVANFGLRKAAQDGQEKYGDSVVDFIQNNFYVDDGLKSLDSVEEAIDMIEKSKGLCRESGLTLHKFTSNSKVVLESLCPEDRSDNTKDLDLRHDTLPIEKTLGVKWCMESDCFKFRVIVDSKPLTRRGVLSTISSVFDPLGFISPVILEGKMILQEMCRGNLDWDDPLPEVLRVRWTRWMESLPSLSSLSIPRCFKPTEFGKVICAEMHHFSDACNAGYGECSYLRLKSEDGRVHCSLVMSKSRVSPIKVMTIPRLELTAAVLSAEVSQLLDKELQYDLQHFFWTDSKIVLGFINSEARRFQVYVSNRVQAIRNVSEPQQWHYVETTSNPADIASRGATADQLASSSWFTGPQFLWQVDLEPQSELFEVDSASSEIKKTVLTTMETERVSEFPIKFSSWNRTVRVIALCIRFINKLRKVSHSHSALQVEELVKAEEILLKQAQSVCFAKELSDLQNGRSLHKSSKIRNLDVFVDNRGLLRVGGRQKQSLMAYENKHPVVLGKDSVISNLIVQHCHERVAHQGRGMTVNAVRNHGYWIIGLSTKVASLVHKCVICRKLRAAVQQQKMGELPSDRLEPGPVFSNVAVDYFGPFHIREGRRDVKRYGVLFTCLNSRAVHIEVSKSLDTDAFINAFRRFLSIRGPVRVLRSDRGTNLMSGYRELREAIASIDDDNVRDFLLTNKCDYIVNVPNASHQGGVWERQIRSMRSVLNVLLGSSGHLLDDDAFRTFMSEAANIVNSRPLTVTSLNDPTSLQPLTPNHLLMMKSNVILPPPGIFKEADTYSRKRWKRVQLLLDSFWSRWKTEVLSLWQTRQKWDKQVQNLQVGDIVLVVDDQLPRCHWRLGRVVEVFPGQDSLVRKVKVMMGDPGLTPKGVRNKSITYLERPVQKLILLYSETRE